MNTHDESKEVVKDNAAPVQIMRLEFSERAIAVIALVFGCVGFVTALWAIHEADRSEREFKQVQVQLMYSNAIMLREGLVQPGDMVYGPEGNLEYRQHELKRKEK